MDLLGKHKINAFLQKLNIFDVVTLLKLATYESLLQARLSVYDRAITAVCSSSQIIIIIVIITIIITIIIIQ